ALRCRLGFSSHGSDAARTAADVELLDGRVHALLDALDEGRELWQRVQAAVAVLLGGNAGEVAFAIIGSAITGRSPLNARQLLLVNMLTDALPATALAVSSLNDSAVAGGHGPDAEALWRTVAVRGVTTASAAVTAWALGLFTGRQRRAATIALVSLVATQLGQTLLDSHDRLVVLTAVGSLGAMGTLISIPGISQLLGCTPLGPVGWTQALGTAAVATAGAAVIPRLLAAPASDIPGPAAPERPGATRVSGNGRATHRGDAEADRTAPRLRVVDNGFDGESTVRPDNDPSVPGGT
ncbi:MAG: cation transporting ATPase C-terminal domain-containing protein, partial [Mycobacterium sp.]